MRLGDICDIHSGYTARSRLEPTATGGVPVIQLRDIDGHGEISEAGLKRHDLNGLADRYLVRGGEVVFKSRGEPNTAMVIGTDMQEPAAVILPLVIMRPDRERVVPAYLAWAINQPDAQRRLAAEAQGTNMRMIPKPVLERLEIALPDLATQRRIVAVEVLVRQERDLLHDLADRRHRLHELILSECAQRASQEGQPQ